MSYLIQTRETLLTFGRRRSICGMIVAAESHVSITSRELIEQKFWIMGFSMRQPTHFIRQRLYSWSFRSLLI